MRTTVDLHPPLLARAKVLASAQNVTLRTLFEEGLTAAIAAREAGAQTQAFRMREVSFVGGEGLTEFALDAGGYAALRDLANDRALS